jgi:hypothetical protein
VLSPKTAQTHAGAIVTTLGLLPAINDHRRVLGVIKDLGTA